MEIISHRGYWKKTEEKNTDIAFERSFSLGFGTETDFRDYLGNVVISHDIATAACIPAEKCFNSYNLFKCEGTLALNIKADGLQKSLKQLLEDSQIKNYFTFDMSIPDTIGYMRESLRFFSRQSEYEPVPAFYEQCNGIWLDAFTGDWYGAGLIFNHLKCKKQVAIVSPDLHKRDPRPFWEYLKKEKIHSASDVMICTDLPEDAKAFFS